MQSVLDYIHQWLKGNMDIVFFIYGLAFVIMGACIWIQPKKGSKFELSNILWLLAAFGIIHGINEFLDMWAIIKGNNSSLDIARPLVLMSSFIFLFEFGRRVIRICGRKYVKAAIRLSMWWLTPVIICAILTAAVRSADFCKTLTNLTRYFLALPGGIITAFGLFLYYKSEENELRGLNIKKYFLVSSAFFLIYGIFGGLVVIKANFFPASWLNTDSFFLVTGIPVQLFRAVCAIAVTWGVLGILNIFNWETTERLKTEIAEHKKALEALSEANINIKEMQDQIIQAEKLNAIGLLASGVAHEVKNPLGIIKQSVEFLEGKMPLADKNISDIFHIIQKNIKRSDNIVRGLIEFSTISVLEKKPEDINSILRSALSLVQYQTKLENIEIAKEMGKDLPRPLVDKNRMEQVFINIFLNAMQAMPKGGRISVRSYLTQLNQSNNGIGNRKEDNFKLGEKAAVIEIEDTGIGIPKENLKKVFDPFFTTKEVGKGTGLGLSVTRNIIALHKGLIEINSKVGEGTKVTITLKL